MASKNVGEINLNRPLENAELTVVITREFRVRLWITLRLVELAMWVAGATLTVEYE